MEKENISSCTPWTKKERMKIIFNLGAIINTLLCAIIEVFSATIFNHPE